MRNLSKNTMKKVAKITAYVLINKQEYPDWVVNYIRVVKNRKRKS